MGLEGAFDVLVSRTSDVGGPRHRGSRCDIDHVVDAQHGGPTCDGNLANECRRHHVLKHQTAWTVTMQPGGVLEWVSSTGRVYPDLPASAVMFAPDPPPF